MRTLTTFMMLGLVLAIGAPARADTCSANMVTEPGIAFSFWCQQPWVDFYWDAYDFDKDDWDGGFGWDQGACDLKRPLGRTFNAIEVLNYAGKIDATSTGDFSGNILHWAGNYTIREFDELDARCGSSPTVRAYTVWGPIVDNYTELYLPFFYNENVVERAATLLHESRHADWCGHSGNDGSNACPAHSESCDEDYYDGCSGFASPSGRGATGYQALWLWWYTVDTDATHGTTTLRNFARDEANRIFDTMFDNDPCFNITNTGAKIIGCR